VRLVELDSSAPGGQTWDPSAVEANARRASDDPTAVAYVGELDFGGSAVSAPVTNRTALLQVSPGDGLTTLTRPDAAQPEEGPARYYPSGHRNFVRLVATDAQQAAALVAWARNRGARRLAIVRDDRLFGRELAAEAVTAAAAGHVPVVTVQEARQGAADYTELVRDLAPTRPDAIVYTGLGDQSGERVLSALAGALPTVPIYGSSALASALPGAALPPADVLKNVAPASAYGPAARRLLQRLHEQTGAPVAPEALYGYDAMRLVLDALGTPGVRPGDRASVTRAALRPRLRRSILGDYTVLPSGDVAPVRLAGYRRAGGRLAFLGLRPVVPGSTSAPTP
jgi:branched-chain amino acid transport system substrate-binding protein